MVPFADILRTTLVVASHAVTLCVLSEPRKRIKHPLFMWFLVFLLLELICLATVVPAGLDETATLLCYAALVILCPFFFSLLSSGSVFRSLFLFLVYATEFMFSVFISTIISAMLFSGNIYATITIRTLISLIVTVLIACCFKRRFLEAAEGMDKGWGLLVVFALIACLSFSAIALAANMIKTESIMLFLFSISFMIFIAVVAILARIIRLMNSRRTVGEMKVQQRILESELASEKAFVENAIKSREDIRHHNSLLLEYLELGDLDGIKEYLQEFDTELDSQAIQSFCDNTAINALMRAASRKCLADGIAFSASLDIPENLPLSGPELVTVFGNILDNAYESCIGDEIDKPFMSFTARSRDGAVFAELQNSIAGNVRWENGLPVRKTGGGTGMKSVESVLARYSGMLECKVESGVFYTRIILPLDNRRISRRRKRLWR